MSATAQQSGEGDNRPELKVVETEKAALDNVVISSVRELSTLQDSMDEIRAELRARGVQQQSCIVMVEMAFHGRQAHMHGMLDAALKNSQQAYGDGAITRAELQEAVDNMLVLEKDIAHTRKLCKQRGLDLKVINMLVQLVRQNPGDGGEKAVNTFLGYALACGIELFEIDEIRKRYTSRPASVLPDIKPRGKNELKMDRMALVRDVAIGLMLTAAMFAFVT